MLKFILKFISIAILAAGIVCFIAFCLSPSMPEVTEDYKPVAIETLKKNFEVNYDFDQPISFPQKVNYSLGKKANWWPKGEAPMLNDLVKKGVLPPVEKRVGSEPLVLEGVDGIGKYGGLWLRCGGNVVQGRIGQIDLFRWSPGGYPRVMNVAKKVEHSKDWKTFTVHFRKGMKWSDGHPFTTDAVKFYLECCDCIAGGTYPQYLKDANGKLATFTFIDKHTFKIEYATPKGDFYEQSISIYHPGHYLRQYHYKFGDQAKIKEIMTAYELGSPRAAYNYMCSRFNPKLPTLYPWIYRSYSAVDPQTYVRNPYFWAVDAMGNQLPYIDAIQTKEVDTKMLPIRAAQGESTIQVRGMDFSQFTELKDKSLQAGKQNIYLWYPNFTSYYLQFSLNRYIDPKKPETKWKAKLLADKRFRQAFSLAINRERIIKAMYHGLSKPEQMKLFAPYAKHPIKDAYVEYSPEKANQLLDSLGCLNKRDSEGFRMFPDGTRACFYIDNSPKTGLGPSEFIADDLKKIGLRVTPRISGNTRNTYIGDYDLISEWSGNSINYRWRFRMGLPMRWLAHVNGADLPPSEHKAFYESSAGKAMELLKIIEQKTPEARIPYVNKLLDIVGEEVYTISIGSPLPTPIVVSKELRNVPKVAVYDHSLGGVGCAGTETYFFETDNSSKAMEIQLENSITTPILRPGAINVEASTIRKFINNFITYLIILLVLVLLVLLVLKYPFALKRLLIMIPTLFIISIVSFIVVQLPPGDYLQTEIVRLQQEGNNDDAQARINELKEMFHYGEPMWKGYLRWSGLYWFSSFKSKDTGLLQGNLGRSMRTMRPINSMIAGRLGFTVGMALVGIILGYLISWPIGIISAVKKGGILDYLLMLLGFLAMCIPPFLIGLILMVISGKSGLFSPEFASQPYWNWAKFYDFMGHVWIPLSIMLIACVSGGGRVFRANILDELKKPYVVTARAKGVRPLKLLLKYPVRMALNPWASSVGSIFPALVGGNAILAIVIGLPTLGPMMLQAIMDQDVYLACANLMLLSSLSVFGVLISDIMLLIVDPRIKYGKG